jgi:hypothetical protein
MASKPMSNNPKPPITQIAETTGADVVRTTLFVAVVAKITAKATPIATILIMYKTNALSRFFSARQVEAEALSKTP